MGWTKRQLVEDVYAELAIAGYDFDLSPDEMQFCLRRLDQQMATWAGLGINLGYAFGLTPDDTDLDQDSGLPLTAVQAVVLNGAISVAASKGKQIGVTTRQLAKQAYDAMLVPIANDQAQQQQNARGTPAGAGNRRITRPYLRRHSTDPIQVDSAGNLDILGN